MEFKAVTGTLPSTYNSFSRVGPPLLNQKEMSPSLSVNDLDMQLLVTPGRAQDEPVGRALNTYGAKGILMTVIQQTLLS